MIAFATRSSLISRAMTDRTSPIPAAEPHRLRPQRCESLLYRKRNEGPQLASGASPASTKLLAQLASVSSRRRHRRVGADGFVCEVWSKRGRLGVVESDWLRDASPALACDGSAEPESRSHTSSPARLNDCRESGQCDARAFKSSWLTASSYWHPFCVSSGFCRLRV